MAVIKSYDSTDQLKVDATSKAARASLYGVDGSIIGHVEGVDGTSNLNVGIIQNVFVSTKNSSIANINAGATWEGPKTLVGGCESTLGIAGIQINTFMDKQHSVTVHQSMDGANWDYSDTHSVPANYGVSRTIQAVGAYYYVSVTNTTAANSTVCRIGVCLAPVLEALPRSLTSGGNLKVTASAEWQNNRLTTGLYATSTFRTLGDTNATQNIFTLENPAASKVDIVIRGLNVATDSTAVLTSVAPQMKLSKPTSLPTGGTVLVPGKYKTSYPTCMAVPRGANASDGGVASAITATAGVTIWSQYIDRLHTAVGWITHPGYNMIPDVGADLRQLILVPGESILIQSVTAMAATTHVIVNCSWLEIASV